MDNIMENRAAFGRGIPAWHRKGKVVAGLLKAEEAVKLAGLDYEVRKVPAWWKDDEAVTEEGAGTFFNEAPGCFLTVAKWPDRAPTVLGQVGEQYTVLQNRDAFAFFDLVVEKGEAVYDSVGVFGRGERVWINALVPGLVYRLPTNRDDAVETHLLLSNSHDGSCAVRGAVTPIRTVCQNTETLAFKKAYDSISIRHTPSMDERLREATRVMAVTRKGFEEMGKAFDAMACRRVTREERAAYITEVLGIDTGAKLSTKQENILEKVGRFFESDPLTDKDTLWAAYNALTAYVDHARTVRQTDKANGSAKLSSIWFGSGAAMKKQAFVKAMALVA